MKTTATLFILVIVLSSCNFRNLNRNFEKRTVATSQKHENSQQQELIVEETTPNDFADKEIIIQDFFSLNQEWFNKNEFHYNRNALKELVNSNNLSDKKGWSNYIVSADGNYLLFENMVDFALIEFKIIERNGQKEAFLNQINDEYQQLTFLEFDADINQWTLGEPIPQPDLFDFFMDHPSAEMETVQEFGTMFAYLSAETDEIEFAFLDHETKKKSKGRYVREADFKFSLAWDDEDFWLEKRPIRK